jgi:hypothetical protein
MEMATYHANVVTAPTNMFREGLQKLFPVSVVGLEQAIVRANKPIVRVQRFHIGNF